MASLHGHSENPLSLPFQPPHIFTLIWQRAGDKTGTGTIVNQIKIVNNNKKNLVLSGQKNGVNGSQEFKRAKVE